MIVHLIVWFFGYCWSLALGHRTVRQDSDFPHKFEHIQVLLVNILDDMNDSVSPNSYAGWDMKII